MVPVDYHKQARLLEFSLGTSLADTCLHVKSPACFGRECCNSQEVGENHLLDDSETTSNSEFIRLTTTGCCLQFRGRSPKLKARKLLTMCQDRGGRQKGTG